MSTEEANIDSAATAEKMARQAHAEIAELRSELEAVREENKELREELQATNKRLDELEERTDFVNFAKNADEVDYEARRSAIAGHLHKKATRERDAGRNPVARMTYEKVEEALHFPDEVSEGAIRNDMRRVADSAPVFHYETGEDGNGQDAYLGIDLRDGDDGGEYL
jgi:septal ring factor EnvC (AmiA/AmiB activator)